MFGSIAMLYSNNRTGIRRQEAEGRWQMAESRKQKAEGRRQKETQPFTRVGYFLL
jgi:hypothetical protein